MKRFVKRFSSGKGFTLIELIVSTTLLALFGGIIFSVITYGVSSYNKIQTENALRDDADLIMSAIINELYTVAPEKVRQLSNGIQLVKDQNANQNRIQVEDGGLIIHGYDEAQGKATVTRVDIHSIIENNDPIQLECGQSGIFEHGQLTCSTGLIEIELVLKQAAGEEPRRMTLKSKFGF
ncbi:prepilin-type N-terminal cleavage/methylation domain-containing protein [Paenibacillus nanensis]|uniref:Prepilin-type N-terminal cleavage/methylation domain-containing protein n=1 Tax=Paenibacillus nanensis TaxID=393251 RepID=A0A3A1UZW2_9BACL|nr:prepilin-type N-terminal cleavage/methylation domain-containing protein [Paenibacillus nanensis]RIX54038.1 prepilin-type N-terminal cleavage/methylation domain-containing protein [Paenibacillus nanensis]